MPRARKASSSDEEYGATQKKGLSQSQSIRISPEELERLASIVANFLLASECKKVPIKKSDVIKLIPKELHRKYVDIHQSAVAMIRDNYGYDVVDMKDSKEKCYIIVNNKEISSFIQENVTGSESDKDISIRGLRTAILAMIFMSGGVVKDNVLNAFIMNFEIDSDSNEIHSLLGNIKTLIYKDFVRQDYLSMKEIKDVDPSFKEVRWGERAFLEINQSDMLKFVCQVYGDHVTPEMWKDIMKLDQ